MITTIIIETIAIIVLISLLISNRNYSIRLAKACTRTKAIIQTQKDEISSWKDANNHLKNQLDTIELNYNDYVTLLAIAPIKVYTQSNFYSIHSFFNNRYYAKINNKTTNNKAEGIPVVELVSSSSKIINLYKLRHIIRKSPMTSFEKALEASITTKQELIQELGNKQLKSYER